MGHMTAPPLSCGTTEVLMTVPGNEFLDRTPQGYGAYLCIRATGGRVDGGRVGALCQRLGLADEFDGSAVKGGSGALLRRHRATAGAIADDEVLHAHCVIHARSTRRGAVRDFRAQTPDAVGPRG